MALNTYSAAAEPAFNPLGTRIRCRLRHEAPAQAELRPNCAGPSRLDPPMILALMGFNPGLNRPAPLASEKKAISSRSDAVRGRCKCPNSRRPFGRVAGMDGSWGQNPKLSPRAPSGHGIKCPKLQRPLGRERQSPKIFLSQFQPTLLFSTSRRDRPLHRRGYISLALSWPIDG